MKKSAKQLKCGGKVKKKKGGQLQVRGCGAAKKGKYLKRNG